MKKVLVGILAFVLILGLVGCSSSPAIPATEETSTTEPTDPTPVETQVIIEPEQNQVIETTAKMHAYIDYEYEFDSIIYKSIVEDDSGNYYTIKGDVVFIDDAGNKYLEESEFVLVKTSNEEQPYRVASWEYNELTAQIDESTDYFEALQKYIIESGMYDNEEKQSYIENEYAQNGFYYLFTKDDYIKFWDIASFESEDEKFFLSYECIFTRDSKPYFSFQYGEYELYDGVVVDGISLDTTGQINAITGEILNIESEKATNCKLEDYTKYITQEQLDCKEFTESIINKANLGITYNQLFG